MKPTTMQTLLQFALRLPETSEGVACAGTTLESSTVTTSNKAFLFLRTTEMRVKLSASLGEAEAHAAKEPARYKVGSNGWVLVKLDGADDPLDLLKRWIQESYSLFGGGKSKASTKSRAVRAKAKTKPGKTESRQRRSAR